MMPEIIVTEPEVVAASVISEALSLLEAGQEADVPLYSHIGRVVGLPNRLPARYFRSQDRSSEIGTFVDKLLDADVESQAEYSTVAIGEPERITYHWLVASSKKHPGLFAVSEVALFGIMKEPVALRGSIMVSPQKDLSNSQRSDFSYFIENVICKRQ